VQKMPNLEEPFPRTSRGTLADNNRWAVKCLQHAAARATVSPRNAHTHLVRRRLGLPGALALLLLLLRGVGHEGVAAEQLQRARHGVRAHVGVQLAVRVHAIIITRAVAAVAITIIPPLATASACLRLARTVSVRLRLGARRLGAGELEVGISTGLLDIKGI
jgi:hypothetical protein